ncbi:CTP synthase (glutamine hydrolyzing) [Candidatus Woesearchaeota archaeon]|nr:CTP synthase (glutamine hydrolyzing) [Candidatus Woesearchaeota archaeon]
MEKKQLKCIVVTGGVLSGLGKGIATASIGNLLCTTTKVIPIKCDGYLNVDPGTMNPIEHGEVFVLDDGGEVDMDFGHYERFLDITCKFKWNLTMGKVFQKIREKERRGDYLGKTVQFVPHVPQLIQEWFFTLADEEQADILLIEVGGTVGDIENELYIEAVRGLKKKLGAENVLYVHLTYIPIPYGVNEQKSKPTQQSVNILRQKGIIPDIIIGRCAKPIHDKIKEKIANLCDVEKEAVITGLDVTNIYQIPLLFEAEGLSNVITKKFNIPFLPQQEKWKQLVENSMSAPESITIAICGKYTSLGDSYASIMEALSHCGAHLQCKVYLKWIETSDPRDFAAELEQVHGVIVPGGFGARGIEGKIAVIKECRENNIPFLGICYGLQLAVVEYARNVCGLQGAQTTEVDKDTRHPVIDILPEQLEVTEKGGTMRLGAYPAVLQEGSMVYTLYGCQKEVSERHRHRYEVNPKYHDQLLHQGNLVFSGMSPNKRLVEFIELANHPYFVATQAHPELKSSLLKPAPLFMGLVKAALERKRNQLGQIEEIKRRKSEGNRITIAL